MPIEITSLSQCREIVQEIFNGFRATLPELDSSSHRLCSGLLDYARIRHGAADGELVIAGLGLAVAAMLAVEEAAAKDSQAQA